MRMPEMQLRFHTVEALLITYIIVGVPDYNYGIVVYYTPKPYSNY